MADLMEKGFQFLADVRTASFATPIRYISGQNVVELNATPGASNWETVNDAGLLTTARVHDFLVRTADLKLPGASDLIEPQAGDRIERDFETTAEDGAIHRETRIYEVAPPGASGGDEPAWRFSGPYERTRRIHTKEIGQR